MSERRDRTMTGAELFGAALFGAGAFVLVLVLLSIQKPFPTDGVGGSAAFAKGVVDWLGRVPAGFLAAIVAWLGARRFLGYGAGRLTLNLVGSLGVTAGLAILCGALWSGTGGSIGAATGGGLARISPILGAVAGLLLMAGSAWLIWLRELVPFPGGSDLRRAISGAARERGADGVSAAEAEALVVPNRPKASASRGVERPASEGAARPLPKPVRGAAPVPAAPAAEEADEIDDDDSDAAPRTDRAHAAPARGPARPSAHPAAQPLVRDLAAEPRPAVPPAAERGATAPAPAAAEPAAPAAAVNPGAAPLKGAPPLGLAGGAQALTRSTSLPRPSWEQGEESEAEELAAAQSEPAPPPNTWRPTRLQGTRAVEEVDADELEEELEEELEGELEDGEELAEEEDDELVAEDGEDGEEEEEYEEEDEEELAAEYDEDLDDEEESDEDESDEEDEEDEEDEDEDEAWDDSEESEEEDEEVEEEEDEAAELEEWEEEDGDSDEDSDEEELEEDLAAELEEGIGGDPEPAAPLPTAARAEVPAAASLDGDGDGVEAELRRLLAEEDARARGAALPKGSAVPAPTPKASDAADALQMDLFGAPPEAAADGSGVVLEPKAPPKSPRRKPAQTPAPQAAAPKAPAPAPVAAAVPGEGPSQLVIDAGCLFLDRGRVAVSMLQKTFDLDFDTSCEVLDTLQNLGLVGPYLGGQRRDILLTREQWLERVGQPSQAAQD